MNVNRRRKNGMALLPVLAITGILAAMMVAMASFKGSASAEEIARNKMAATSAVNKAAVELRTTGSLPASKSVMVEGIAVQVSSTLSADGNTVKLSADGQGEVVQATAVRQVEVAPQAANTSGFYLFSTSMAMNDAAATHGGGWTVYNSDNVVISKDAINRSALLPKPVVVAPPAPEVAVAPAAEVPAVDVPTVAPVAAEGPAEKLITPTATGPVQDQLASIFELVSRIKASGGKEGALGGLSPQKGGFGSFGSFGGGGVMKADGSR